MANILFAAETFACGVSRFATESAARSGQSWAAQQFKKEIAKFECVPAV